MGPISVLLNQLSYPHRTRVKDDVKQLLEAYKSLVPKIVTYVHNSGTESKLLSLAGTIPIFFNGVQYNIPVELFICLQYPHECPHMYVRPTPNMIIKNNHRHVDMQGMVYLPYLHEWKVHSNLVKLVEVASGVFSIEPPLFSRPATTTTNNNINSNNNHNQTIAARKCNPDFLTNNHNSSTTVQNMQNNNNTNVNSFSNIPSVTLSTTANNNVNTVNPNRNSIATTNANHYIADRKAQLQERATFKLQEELHNAYLKNRDDLNKEFNNQSYLSQSTEEAKATKQELQALVSELQQALTSMEVKQAALGSFVQAQADAERDEIGASKKKVTAEERIVPFDAISNQIITLNARVNAVDDCFYYLEKAMTSYTNKAVDLPTYLRECRNLSRQQFLDKVHLLKIDKFCNSSQYAQQQHEQMNNMSSRSSQGVASPPAISINALNGSASNHNSQRSTASNSHGNNNVQSILSNIPSVSVNNNTNNNTTNMYRPYPAL